MVSSHVEGIGAHTGATLTNSLAYSQTNASVVGHGQFNSVNLVSGIRSRQKENENKIEEDKNIENQSKETSQVEEYKLPVDDVDDELEREEDDNFYIEVDTPVTQKSASHNHRKAKTARSELNQDLEPQPIPKYNLDFPDQYVNPNLLDQTNLYESQEVLLDDRKETYRDYVETQMYLFHFNFDFDLDSMILDQNGDIPSFPFMDYKPTEEEIYYYCKYVLLASKMEKEIPLMALVYIERLMTWTGMLLNHWNWKRLVMTVLITASKVWDDDSLENIHFPQVMPDISLKEVNTWEKIFLELIDYKLHIRGAEYAKYYFILQTIANEFERSELELPIEDYPLDATM